MKSIDLHPTIEQNSTNQKLKPVYTVSNTKVRTKHLHEKSKARHESQGVYNFSKLMPKWKEDAVNYLNRMILYLTDQINPQFSQDAEITLLKSVLNIYLLKNHFEAFYQISRIQNLGSLSTEQDLTIHRLKKTAESFISKNSTLFNTDIEDMILSHHNFHRFLDTVEVTTRNMVFFWKGLLPENPSFDQLNEISGKITDDNEALKR